MSRLTPRFSSDRMVREHVERAYLPAVQAYRRRAGEHAQLAQAIEDWQRVVHQNWLGMRFGEIRVHEEDGQWRFDVQAYLGDLPPEAVRAWSCTRRRGPPCR
jgi:starch phosphorylase